MQEEADADPLEQQDFVSAVFAQQAGFASSFFTAVVVSVCAKETVVAKATKNKKENNDFIEFKFF